MKFVNQPGTSLEMSDFRTLKRTSLLYSSALFLLSLPGVTGKIPGLEVKGVSAGFALFALASAAFYYFAEFAIAWYRQMQPELRETTAWHTEVEADSRTAIHNLRNVLDHDMRIIGELTETTASLRQTLARHQNPENVPSTDVHGLLLNVERSLRELNENDLRTKDRLVQLHSVTRGMLVFGAVKRLQLFWFDLIWPSALFVAAMLHFFGCYPALTIAPSLPELFSRANLVPLVR